MPTDWAVPRRPALLWSLALLALVLLGRAAEAGTVRLGVLKFGTVSWELDAVKAHKLDEAEGVTLEIVELAGKDATSIALQAGEVDMIVTDWLWVSRQRSEGAKLAFFPYSTAVGALVVPADSPARSLADLKGKKIGVAGGPIDKSWLLMRALSLQQHGFDLAEAAEPVFAAPPLLNEELLMGRLDAVLNFWHFTARLDAAGQRTLITVDEALQALGLTTDVPLLGYVFDETWAEARRDDVLAFSRASQKAKALLTESDAEWERLRPLMQAEDEATFRALREYYRRGIPRRWGDAERADAGRFFAVLAKLGGPELVGDASDIAEGTFWPHVTY